MRFPYASACCLALLLAAVGPAGAQALYKYRGDDGEWIYADRPPGDDRLTEVRELGADDPDAEFGVSYTLAGTTVELIAENPFYAPVEMRLVVKNIRGLEYPDPEDDLRWVVPPRSQTLLIGLDLLEGGPPPFLEYRFGYLAGDPAAEHDPPTAYRVPYAIATNNPVTQAYPDIFTHTSPDSYHAVDMAMPVGTDVFAARGGIVFDVASDNFRGGLDPRRDGQAANVVRILHDDGTYAIYAHLNWNSIRVRPGDRVRRGEYIADSGNTGFSSGPHLHFAVVRNAGMYIESIPVEFQGADSAAVKPATGMALTAY